MDIKQSENQPPIKKIRQLIAGGQYQLVQTGNGDIVEMKIEHRKQVVDPLKDLSTLQKRCLTAAIILAFVGIFVWFFKILFF